MVDIVGRTTHIATRAYVYLPPEYFQSRYRTRTFPAAVVLTGYPGTALALVDKLHYPRTALELAKSGRMQPMILVMLRPTVAPPRDTECVDVPGGPQTESFFAKDLPDAVLEHRRLHGRLLRAEARPAPPRGVRGRGGPVGVLRRAGRPDHG
jgi:hypothetical protein